MTEQEWLTSTDPGPMLKFLQGKTTDRKLRLFTVACCRRLPLEHLPGGKLVAALALAERVAEGAMIFEEWRAAHDALTGRALKNETVAVVSMLYQATRASILSMLDAATRAVSHMEGRRGREGPAQSALLRDIFGPLPLRPVTIEPSVLAWNDRLVRRLAQAIYDERRWGDMPILGDALLDAGCDDDEVVAHCRAGGEHVRGCWVVDLCLGKS